MPGSKSYWSLSTRPLHVLAFLSPLILFYEFGTARFLTRAGVVETIGAQSMLYGFFAAFGAWSTFLPGVALAAVLLVWHLLIGDRWRLKLSVLGGMLVESAVLTLPLLVMGLFILGDRSARPAMGGAEVQVTQLQQLPIVAKLTLAIGAGIYEELLFRLILITALHFLLVDLFKLPDWSGSVVATVVSAVAFALYHHHTDPSGLVDRRLLLFYTAAGLYFGSLFLLRGFGVVVATHALYDVVALVLIRNTN